LRELYPGGTTSNFTGRSQMERVMLSGGEGTRGVVFGSRASGPGHVFNGVVSNGRVVFVDGGSRASLKGYSEFDVFFTQIGGGF
jgi:hypothetical protein